MNPRSKRPIPAIDKSCSTAIHVVGLSTDMAGFRSRMLDVSGVDLSNVRSSYDSRINRVATSKSVHAEATSSRAVAVTT